MPVALVRIFLLLLAGVLTLPMALAAGVGKEPSWPETKLTPAQYAVFPKPLDQYQEKVGGSAWEVILSRAAADWFNLAATGIFLAAIAHTFLAGWLGKRAHAVEEAHLLRIAQLRRRAIDKDDEEAVDDVSLRGSLLHWLSEVEVIFGLWVVVLAVVASARFGFGEWAEYLGRDRSFVEPMFVVVIMAISASRPVVRFVEGLLAAVAKLGRGSAAAWWWSLLTIGPLLGSFVTEPAAMTICALLLAKRFYRLKPSKRFAYATLGLLFVNVSVGGTLTYFAAPPVLMVAQKWGFHEPAWFMWQHFGYKAVLGIVAANLVYFLVFARELKLMAAREAGEAAAEEARPSWTERSEGVPWWVTLVHLGFLGWTVLVAHDPVLFVGGFLFFLGFVGATAHHQNPVRLQGPILVGFFLAALVIHGGLQSWWIEPILTRLSAQPMQLGATILTAFNDNAAITFLASQVPGLSSELKHAVVAGAVIGGGLTVIANAPNPAGQSLLRQYFPGQSISPLGLLLGALLPTGLMYLAFSILPNLG